MVYEGNERVIYVELLKALYGTIRAARLFWEKLSGHLQEWGFIPNPYDPCVVNKDINGKQCTVAWHVDDIKISHVDALVVDHVINLLDEEFGQESPLTVSRGTAHEYLGMHFDFAVKGEVTIDMIAYIKSVLAEMPEEMKGKAPSPAAAHLFKVNENPVSIDDDHATIFHRLVMQVQYMSQRARPDLRTAVSFLSRRVAKPDVDDYRKLTRLMRYIQATIYLKLTLSADGSRSIRWWIDASYAVHADMKGHTGVTMSMGRGSVYSSSSAQKLKCKELNGE